MGSSARYSSLTLQVSLPDCTASFLWNKTNDPDPLFLKYYAVGLGYYMSGTVHVGIIIDFWCYKLFISHIQLMQFDSTTSWRVIVKLTGLMPTPCILS